MDATRNSSPSLLFGGSGFVSGCGFLTWRHFHSRHALLDTFFALHFALALIYPGPYALLTLDCAWLGTPHRHRTCLPSVDNPFAFLPTPDEDAPNAPPHPHPTQESMMSSLDFTGVSFPASSAFTFSVTAGDADNNEITPSASTGGRGSRRAAARAPSYIPRPPNAFILFRSSTLSKIIGKYWHALPPAERARWEDKARLAQAEHRRRYPDWRFRPGNGKNAFISGASGPVASGSSSGSSAKPRGRRKGRIKDGGGDDPDPPPPSTPPPPDDDEERGRQR
ncbi:hypothetical protein B0H16DRAFT_1716906 [Mycena metata]|uniref:HMG box domain-containing protein n=1 Tax=Mycena metata TaxID=1033252 RepID=A0AAD7JLA5_9AGAR|nr:hypothetical protein B0H16DRAFT_1716906 [Mycena metata]